MSKPCRISVRVTDEQWAYLHKCEEETGTDFSTVVRQALQAHIAGAAPNGNGPARKLLTPPELLMPLMPKYRGWGDGDIRKERERLFRELLAASFACKLFFPRTPKMIEGYIELRQLARFFGIAEHCQTK